MGSTVALLLALLSQQLLAPTSVVMALDNGLGLVPVMGYNAWFDMTALDWGGLNESMVRKTADKMIELGLDKLGYKYVNLDDGYMHSRSNSTGVLQPDPTTFPSGLRNLSDFLHGRGLLFGIYTARCAQTCCGRPGSLGHEALDARTFAHAWRVDLVKEDSCGGCPASVQPITQYATMGAELNKTGRPIYFDLCAPGEIPVAQFPEAKRTGNSWRIGPDVGAWLPLLENIDLNSQYAKYAGPGGFNNPCMLISRYSNGQSLLTERQIRAQFSMWAMMASPLIISGSILKMSAETLATYSNPAVVAIDQVSYLISHQIVTTQVSIWIAN
jgi:alpha-galactosidase